MFASVIVVALGILIGMAWIAWTGLIADASHPVVTVDGRTADRSQLRARMRLEAVLLSVRESAIRTAEASGRLAPGEAQALFARLATGPDPVAQAIEGIVADDLLRNAMPAVAMDVKADLATEVGAAATRDLAVRVGWVVIVGQLDAVPPSVPGWPSPPRGSSRAMYEAERSKAIDRARLALADGTTAADVVHELEAAGWLARGGQRWLARDGAEAGLPDSLVAAARRRSGPGMLDPVADRISGTAAVATVLEIGKADDAAAVEAVRQAGIDDAVLRAWVEARAIERIVRADLATQWRGVPTPQTRVAEVVIGPAPVEGVAGPFVSFAHLVFDQVPPAERPSGSDPIGVLAADLRSLPPVEREARFVELVDHANRTPSDDPLRQSGELGYFSKDQLLPALGTLAFSDGVAPGDILGPVTTVAGLELFIVRGRFEGKLDERSNAALVEARTTADLVALAGRIAPAGEAPRADGTLWRADAEVSADAALRRAYRETPIGRVSEPAVLNGELLVVQPLERRTAPADPEMLDRLDVRGFDAWLAEQISRAAIVRDPEPLPGVTLDESPSPTTEGASTSPDPRAGPSAPAGQPSVGVDVPTPPPLRP